MSAWLIATLPFAIALIALLVHDFRAGLSEERLWSDPWVDDPEATRVWSKPPQAQTSVSEASIRRLQKLRDQAEVQPVADRQAKSA